MQLDGVILKLSNKVKGLIFFNIKNHIIKLDMAE